MTGKEIVNLIYALEKEGMTAEKIIEIIKYNLYYKAESIDTTRNTCKV